LPAIQRRLPARGRVTDLGDWSWSR